MSMEIIETTYGKVKGIEYQNEYKGITVFKGIPYAAPPLGKLRFAPPVKPERWEDIRECNEFGPISIQTKLDKRHSREYYFKGIPEMSEDCLYLNICTGASRPEEKRPVFIWFHGGGLTNCNADEIQFNPQVLAQKGIIVITVGQRLGIFGYLCIPQLRKEQGKSGNYGFMDQLMALDWVTDNVAKFGGDPNNITIGGQSGGALKCCVLAASPAAKGRIKRVINQSGNKWMIDFPTIESQEALGKRCLQYAGIDPNISLDELRKLDTYDIFKNQPRAVTPGDMVYDDELIPCYSVRELFEKYLGDVDFINGSDAGESDVFGETKSGLNEVPVRNYMKTINSKYDFYAHFRNLLGDLYTKYDFENMVKVTDESANDTARILAYYGLCGSEGMNVSRNLMLNRYFGMYFKKKHPNSKYFSYIWTHKLPCPDSDKGTSEDMNILWAWHSTELWYTFASMRKGIPPHREWTELDYHLSDVISTYWAEFMKKGNPNKDLLPEWPESNKNYGYVELGDEIIPHQGLSDNLERLIYEFVLKEYKLEALS